MSITLRIISIIFSIGFLLLIFELVRRKKLMENYSLTWFFVGGVVLLFSLLGDRLDFFFTTIGFIRSSNAILVVSVFLILVILLGLSVAVSRLSGQSQTLTQELGLLRNKLEESEKKNGAR